jgi:hypothetical protein
MTATELQKRNEKSDHLRVLQTDSGQFLWNPVKAKSCTA